MRAIEEDPAAVGGGACLEALALAGEAVAQKRTERGSHESSDHVVGILGERQLATGSDGRSPEGCRGKTVEVRARVSVASVAKERSDGLARGHDRLQVRDAQPSPCSDALRPRLRAPRFPEGVKSADPIRGVTQILDRAQTARGGIASHGLMLPFSSISQ